MALESRPACGFGQRGVTGWGGFGVFFFGSLVCVWAVVGQSLFSSSLLFVCETCYPCLARGPAAVQAWPLLVVTTIGTGRAPPVGGGPPFDVDCTAVEGGYRTLCCRLTICHTDL